MGVEHPLRPPVADATSLQPGRAQPVEEPVGDGLHVAVDELRLHPDAHALAARHGAFGRGGPAGRELQQRLVPEARVLERRQVVVRNVVVVDQGADRLRGRHRRQRPDLLGRAAEARTTQQVLGAVVAPVRRGDGGQVGLPGRGSRIPVLSVGHRGVAADKKRQRGAGDHGGTTVSSRHRWHLLRPAACPPGTRPLPPAGISIVDARAGLSSPPLVWTRGRPGIPPWRRRSSYSAGSMRSRAAAPPSGSLLRNAPPVSTYSRPSGPCLTSRMRCRRSTSSHSRATPGPAR